MKQNHLNNPVLLHFYRPEERLPDFDDYKIVIVKSKHFGNITCLACYDLIDKKWTDDHLYELDNVIAWASFSPDWVVSERDLGIFGYK